MYLKKSSRHTNICVVMIWSKPIIGVSGMHTVPIGKRCTWLRDTNIARWRKIDDTLGGSTKNLEQLTVITLTNKFTKCKLCLFSVNMNFFLQNVLVSESIRHWEVYFTLFINSIITDWHSMVMLIIVSVWKLLNYQRMVGHVYESCH